MFFVKDMVNIQPITEDETVMSRPSYEVFLKKNKICAITILIVLAIYTLFPLVVVLLALLHAYVYFENKSVEIVITNERIIEKSGWLKSETRELPVEDIEKVDIKQDLGDKLFGSKTIIVTEKDGTTFEIRRIDNAEEVKKSIESVVRMKKRNQA